MLTIWSNGGNSSIRDTWLHSLPIERLTHLILDNTCYMDGMKAMSYILNKAQNLEHLQFDLQLPFKPDTYLIGDPIVKRKEHDELKNMIENYKKQTKINLCVIHRRSCETDPYF